MITNSDLINHSVLNNSLGEHPRVHAKGLDHALGYKIPKIELKLLQKYRAYDQRHDDSNKKQHFKGTQTWIGLHPQALQTPYCDIYKALSLFKNFDIKHVVDIGAGYGRVGIVLSVLYPNAIFTGFEILKKRQLEGNRIFEKLKMNNSKILLKNVLDSDFDLPDADIYFIYDFSEQEDIFQILQTLSTRIKSKKFFLITKGERIDYLMKRKYKHIWRLKVSLDTTDLKIYTSRNV